MGKHSTEESGEGINGGGIPAANYIPETHTISFFFAPNSDSHWYIWDPSATATSPVSPACFTGWQAGNQQTGHPTGTRTHIQEVSSSGVRAAPWEGQLLVAAFWQLDTHADGQILYMCTYATTPSWRVAFSGSNSWNTLSELHVVNVYPANRRPTCVRGALNGRLWNVTYQERIRWEKKKQPECLFACCICNSRCSALFPSGWLQACAGSVSIHGGRASLCFLTIHPNVDENARES